MMAAKKSRYYMPLPSGDNCLSNQKERIRYDNCCHALSTTRTTTIMLLPMVDLFAGGETRRPIELVAFGMGTNQGVGAQLGEGAASLKSECSNHAFERL